MSLHTLQAETLRVCFSSVVVTVYFPAVISVFTAALEQCDMYVMHLQRTIS